MAIRSETLNHKQSGVIKDMVLYRRALNNHSMGQAVAEVGIGASTFSEMERNTTRQLPKNFVKILEPYLGCDPGTLVDIADSVVKILEGLEQEFDEPLQLGKRNLVKPIEGHMRLIRTVGLPQSNRFYQRSGVKFGLLVPEKLPHLDVFLEQANMDALVESQKLPILEEITVVSFKKVRELNPEVR